MSDLVERLRQIGEHDWRVSILAHTPDTANEAADELTRLRADHESEMKRVDGLLNNYERGVDKLRVERDAAVAIAAQKSEQYVAERKAHNAAVAREVVLRKALEHMAVYGDVDETVDSALATPSPRAQVTLAVVEAACAYVDTCHREFHDALEASVRALRALDSDSPGSG